MMKKFLGLTVFLSLFLSLPTKAFAYRASHFKGLYEVRAEHVASPLEDPPAKKYVLCDVDTVGNIWIKYGEGDLPADLVPIKDEPSILLGFTFRSGLFFNLERSALIGDTALSMPGAKNNTMELRRKPDGSYDLGVRIDNVVTFFDLGPQEPLNRNRLPIALPID